MSDTITCDCLCCGEITDCIDGFCQPCRIFNDTLLKQRDALLEACKKMVECAPKLWGEPENWPKVMDRIESAIAQAEKEWIILSMS